VGEDDVRAVVDAFNKAWGDHDLDATVAMLTDDAVFDATGPAPDGQRATGPSQIRAAWEPIFSNPDSLFEVEQSFVAGDRLVQLWRYSWGDGHVRGIDVFRVAGDKVAEKLSYVKG
jgi:uncharacterized protein (TIGR02246 family)